MMKTVKKERSKITKAEFMNLYWKVEEVEKEKYNRLYTIERERQGTERKEANSLSSWGPYKLNNVSSFATPACEVRFGLK